VETQVLRRLSGVEPLVSLIGTAVLEARNNCCRHTIGETVYEHVDRGGIVTAQLTHPS
jgi:hypothetical protein